MKHSTLILLTSISLICFTHAETDENDKPKIKELESIIEQQQIQIETLENIQIPSAKVAEIHAAYNRLLNEKNALEQILSAIDPVAVEKAGFYIIRAGDTLKRISTKTKLKIDIIYKLNPQIDATKLRIGQVLRIKPEMPLQPHNQ